MEVRKYENAGHYFSIPKTNTRVFYQKKGRETISIR
jgi:hypothetical protein